VSDARVDVRAELERARSDGLQRISTATDLASLDEAKVRVLGRKAALSQARSGLRDAPPDERPALGQLANDVQAQLEQAIDEKRRFFETTELARRWERERVDVTLPGEPVPIGSLHPLTRMIWQVVDVFVGLGYKMVEGPEVELSKYNFDALNTPPKHPSRSPSDTFYIEGTNEQVCLRSQTSPMQIRTMEASPPPVYTVVPGRCYRRDELDATHLSGFTQIEGLAVDEGITMGDLKGTLETVVKAIFGADVQTRLRASHFPFTEPSAELDAQCFVCKGRGCRVCKGEGWIELLGCGMVHPHLLEWVGYDTERYTGFAFGMGVERFAALAHGVNDIRYFYENDLRFLGVFRGML
jgi:phenylalanyl-tRNA synthetase alpha chain